MNTASAAAREALNGDWGSTSLQERADLLHKVADVIGKRFDYDGPTRTTAAAQQLSNPHLLIETKVVAHRLAEEKQ